MGLRVAAFGVETFNPIASKAIGKNMSASKAKKFLEDLNNIHWNNKIRIHCYMMSGLPGESLESVKQSMDWFHSRPFSSHFGTFSLDPASEDKSRITSNPEMFGYKIDENGKWYNSLITQHQSEMFFAKHFLTMVKRNVYYEGFGLMGAFKHYNIDEVMKLTWRDVVNNSEQIYNEKIGFINEYKTRLFAL